MALRLILSLFLLIGLALPVFARLGETEAELIARYGEPKRPHQTDPQIIELSFASEGWIIKALIYEGKCQYICYLKSPYYEGFEEARDKLLEANAQGSAWSLKKLPSVLLLPAKYRYEREDGLAYAEIPKQGYIRAEFYTVKWEEYGKAKEAAKRKPGPLPNF